VLTNAHTDIDAHHVTASNYNSKTRTFLQ